MLAPFIPNVTNDALDEKASNAVLDLEGQVTFCTELCVDALEYSDAHSEVSALTPCRQKSSVGSSFWECASSYSLTLGSRKRKLQLVHTKLRRGGGHVGETQLLCAE